MLLEVLYIDDEPDLCEIFSEEFASPEVSITTYTDPRPAIEHAKRKVFDLVFVDYRLPGTNGTEVAKSLQCSGAIILVTGENIVDTDYSFAKILKKPFERQEIHDTIAACLAGRI